MDTYINPVDLAWFAGLFEGEGTIVFPSAQKWSVVMTIFMTDRDVLEHAHDVVGVGAVRGPYINKARPRNKPIFKWSTAKREDVSRLLLAIYPLMGERRRARITEAADRLAYKRVAWNKSTCKHGVVGAKNCATCRSGWRADHYDKQKRMAAERGVPISQFRMKET